MLAVKRQRLDRQFVKGIMKPEAYVAKSRIMSNRRDRLRSRLHSLESLRFIFEQEYLPTKLPEVGIGNLYNHIFELQPTPDEINNVTKQQ